MDESCTVCNDNKIDNGIDVGNVNEIFGNNFFNFVELYKKGLVLELHKDIDKITDTDVYNKMFKYVGQVDASTLNRWKNKKAVPSAEQLVKISKFFGCTVDELITNSNPYAELEKYLEDNGFSGKLITKLIEILKIKRMTQAHLFGEPKETPVINVVDFYTELITGDDVNEVIKIFNSILSAFDDLTENELEQCEKVIKENKDKYISKYKDNYTLQLETLEVNLPSEVRDSIVRYKDELDTFIKLNTSAYIMRLFNQISNTSEKSEVL